MSLLDSLKRATNFTETENGAVAHKTTMKKVYDMFALGGAYRTRSDDDCILLFKNAFEEDAELALKCLFYLRDIRGGQGERRFFRVCFNWLAKNYPNVVRRNLDNVAEYGRYDDLYCLMNTPVEKDVFALIRTQLEADIVSLKDGDKEGVSLLAKWLKSENASSRETKEFANKTRIALQMTHRAYRKMLSTLRKRINIVERLMSEGQWEQIEYAKLPSKAGLIYRNAFAKRDAERYKAFIASKETKVNASTIYPYEIVKGVTKYIYFYGDGFSSNFTETERETLNKFWANKKDYLNGANKKILTVADTSGSMTATYNTSVAPIDVAISLAMYSAEGLTGPFANHFMTFASRPNLLEVEGVDFCDKVRRIYIQNLCDNTNLTAVFDLLKNLIINQEANIEDLPETIVVVSDMEIDGGSYWRNSLARQTEMERIRKEWNNLGLRLPNLVYWNVNARNNIILDNPDEEGVSFVSGFSPVLFESVITGKSGWDLCLDKLLSDRYNNVK